MVCRWLRPRRSFRQQGASEIMDRVKVTFFMEVTDSADKTGVTMEDFDNIHEVISGALGGDEIVIEKVSE
jgi:hypothetical protein